MARVCIDQFRACKASIGEDMPQPRTAEADGLDHIRRAVPVLDVGGMNEYEEQEAECVGDDVALAAFHLLSRVIPANAAAFGGLDGLASLPSGLTRGMMPAVGLASLPACSRAAITSNWLIDANNILSRHA